MAWFDSAWLYRMPLTFANHSGVAAPEGQFIIPAAFGRFWDDATGVLSTFNDVRITAADGVTLLAFNFTSATQSHANRDCTITIDETDHNVATLYGNSNAASSASVGAWLYWGNDAVTAPGNDTGISITTTPKTVLIDLSDPRSSATAFVVTCRGLGLSQVYYHTELRKSSTDTSRIYWDLSGVVLGLRRNNQGSKKNEEIAYATCIIYDQDGANTTSAMTTLNEITILPGYIVQMPITAGDHEKRYSIIMTFGLVDQAGSVRVTEQRATLHVRNPGLHPALNIT